MGKRHEATKTVGHPLHPMLVAFPVTFFTSSWLAFLVYACTESSFWWQVGLGSNAAGLLTTLLAALIASARVRLSLSAFAFFALNLCAHLDCWAAGPHSALARPLVSGEVQVLVLPDAGFALVLTGLGWLLTLLAGLGVTPVTLGSSARTQRVSVEQPRLEVRPSRPLIQT